MAEKPRLRFAPSPTGYLHIGGARTALFNWLYARRHGGTFVLRVEDTDQSRSTEESVQAILDGMRWLGLDWDEGPFRQTDRLEIYREHAERLIEADKAYRCYCTKEDLEALREAHQQSGAEAQFRYPGTCRERTDHPDLPYVVRMRMPETGETVFEDMVRGRIATPHDTLQDEIILRSDGFPLYNFGAVVDDATMGITVVARGDDHINNTARQILMYEALGWTPPRFAHLPMILGEDRQRLSKRHGAVSVMAYHDEGYLSHAMVNYLVRLGWSLDDKTEIFSLEDLLRHFDFDRVGKAASVFNLEKLQWLNQHWMKETGDAELAGLLAEQLAALGIEADGDPRLPRLAGLLKARTKTGREMAETARVYFTEGVPAYDEKAVKKFFTETSRPHLEAAKARLAEEAPDAVDEAGLEAWLRAYAGEQGVGLGKIAQPLRVALVGGTASPGIFETVALIGRDESIRRLEAALGMIP
jgi:glutamyl-tRNA synthetase